MLILIVLVVRKRKNGNTQEVSLNSVTASAFDHQEERQSGRESIYANAGFAEGTGNYGAAAFDSATYQSGVDVIYASGAAFHDDHDGGIVCKYQVLCYQEGTFARFLIEKRTHDRWNNGTNNRNCL